MKNDEFLKKSSEPNVNPNVIQFLSVRNTTFAYLPYTLMDAWLTYLRKCYIEGGTGRTAREKPTHRKKKAAIFHKKLILTIYFTPTNVLIQFEFGSHVSIPSLHSSISSHFCLYFCACSRPTPDGALPR